MNKKDEVEMDIPKIKVFISSKCGDHGKYDDLRKRLVKRIEDTHLMKTYVFENEGSSILPVQYEYITHLEESDTCIFIIDNKDGVSESVRRELETAEKNGISSLYYFCDQDSDTETDVQKHLDASEEYKYSVVHQFSQLGNKIYTDLLKNITEIYHYFCRHKITIANQAMVHRQDLIKTGYVPEIKISQEVIEKVEKSTKYLYTFLNLGKFENNEDYTFETLDDWVYQMLKVLFEGMSIKTFNYHEFVKKYCEEHYVGLIEKRWKAIDQYFSDNLQEAHDTLEEAVQDAQYMKCPDWVVKDLLIDLRNSENILNEQNNTYGALAAQGELNKYEDVFYYPAIDRKHSDLYEKFQKKIYEQDIQSIGATTIDNDEVKALETILEILAIAMINGSLTHILNIYSDLKSFVHYQSLKGETWRVDFNLYLFSIIKGKEKEFLDIEKKYPMFLNNLTSQDAELIMKFMMNEPNKHRRTIFQLRAFSAVAYYLNDEKYRQYEEMIIDFINDWICSENPNVIIGERLFGCLPRISGRLNLDVQVKLCKHAVENHMYRFYNSLIEFILRDLDIDQLNDEDRNYFVNEIIYLIEDNKKRDYITIHGGYLSAFCNKSAKVKEKLTPVIKQYFNNYYFIDEFLLETSQEEDVIFESTINLLEKQSKNLNKDIITNINTLGIIEALVCSKKISICDDDIDRLVVILHRILLKENVFETEKMVALLVLVQIVSRDMRHYERNKDAYLDLFNHKDEVIIANKMFDISSASYDELNFALNFLEVIVTGHTNTELFDYLSSLNDENESELSVVEFLQVYYREVPRVSLPKELEMMIMLKVNEWLNVRDLDIRFYATDILISLSSNQTFSALINKKFIYIVDHDLAYIKNLILNRFNDIKNLTEDNRTYIGNKLETDTNYVIRTKANELLNM